MQINYNCANCGKIGSRRYAKDRVPSVFFCSVPCQNEWQKSRKDIVEKNKDPEFRKKVSAGLKRRKQELGDNYHSADVKRKIGDDTKKRWNDYDDATRKKILDTLKANSKRRTFGPYDIEWNRLSSSIRENNICHRCGKNTDLVVHHIIPISVGGTREKDNLVVLCSACHPVVERQTKVLFEIIPDWYILQSLIRERLHII